MASKMKELGDLTRLLLKSKLGGLEDISGQADRSITAIHENIYGLMSSLLFNTVDV